MITVWIYDKWYKHVMKNTSYCTFILTSSPVPLWPTPPTQYSPWNIRIPDTWRNLDLMFGPSSLFFISVLKHRMLVTSAIGDWNWREYVISLGLFHSSPISLLYLLISTLKTIKCKQINTSFKHSRYLANRIPIFS